MDPDADSGGEGGEAQLSAPGQAEVWGEEGRRRQEAGGVPAEAKGSSRGAQEVPPEEGSPVQKAERQDQEGSAADGRQDWAALGEDTRADGTVVVTFFYFIF